jgi:HAE1 family hydrophobic/amphiphilic exporter-1
VITGLTLPIAADRHLPRSCTRCGFTINMITLMALSLCVGLLIDDAIVVRENIVRHVQMGKSASTRRCDGHRRRSAWRCWPPPSPSCAVFLPIGFMGGIIGKFFHEFGMTIVAAVLISMFVSFTLDPMLSSVWHDPSSTTTAGTGAAGSARTTGRMGRVDRLVRPRSPNRLPRDGYQAHACAGRCAHQARDACCWPLAHLHRQHSAWCPLLGTEFVPKADFSETTVNFYTPVGSSLERTEARARQVEAILREYPRGALHRRPPSIPAARPGNDVREHLRCAWSTASRAARSVDEIAVCCASA